MGWCESVVRSQKGLRPTLPHSHVHCCCYQYCMAVCYWYSSGGACLRRCSHPTILNCLHVTLHSDHSGSKCTHSSESKTHAKQNAPGKATSKSLQQCGCKCGGEAVGTSGSITEAQSLEHPDLLGQSSGVSWNVITDMAVGWHWRSQAAAGTEYCQRNYTTLIFSNISQLLVRFCIELKEQ